MTEPVKRGGNDEIRLDAGVSEAPCREPAQRTRQFGAFPVFLLIDHLFGASGHFEQRGGAFPRELLFRVQTIRADVQDSVKFSAAAGADRIPDERQFLKTVFAEHIRRAVERNPAAHGAVQRNIKPEKPEK